VPYELAKAIYPMRKVINLQAALALRKFSSPDVVTVTKVFTCALIV